MDNLYDVVIVGGGPAGLTAALYCARAKRRTLVLEKAVPGGQIAVTYWVENYPGFPEGIGGFELGDRMRQQAEKYGAEVAYPEVTGVDFSQKIKVVRTAEADYQGKAVIIAGGAEPRKLGVPGEAALTGRGVSYCATCDGAFFKDQVVAVVGGGDSAIDEGLFLTRFAQKIIVIHRRHELRAIPILQERAFAEPKMEFIWDTVVEAIRGQEEVEYLELRNVKTEATSQLPVGGVFVYVGLHPMSDYLRGVLPMDNAGHIEVNLTMETSTPGVFAAGDIRIFSARQAVTAAGDGATAAISAERYLSEHWEGKA